MPTFRTAVVSEVLLERRGLQRVRVSFDEADVPGDQAYVLVDLIGAVSVGDHVVANTTAVELGLGTGGWHVVHWNLSRTTHQRPGPDHIMKLRYTSLQFDAGTDELRHPGLPPTIDPMVVVGTSVHSQVATIAAVARVLAPSASIVFVMTDGASLPLALSDLVHELKERSILDATVTCGHSFGGDLEAVNVASGLQLARWVLQADIAVVGMGPGVVGTGTTLGNTGLEAASILDMAERLGASPVLAVRASSGDQRERHAGISHHSETISRLCRCEPWVAPVPVEASALSGVRVRRVEIPDTARILDDLGLTITTMGRSPAQDELFFQAAGAAAAVAVDLLALS